jgi:predicted nucleic acid-binding protein
VVRIYLDVSCLNRPYDDQQQARIRLETEAISIIMERFEEGRWLHLASDMAVIEIEATPDAKRRRRALSLLPDRSEIAPLDEAIWSRATECEAMGFKPADAVHVAAAEAMRADVLLTCDDRMFKAGVRNRTRLHVGVANPLSWLKEHEDDSNT